MWFPKILTYGNWGGPGWSSGKFTNIKSEVNWKKLHIDNLDLIFKVHDFFYQKVNDPKNGDIFLTRMIFKKNVKGVWSNIYRILAYSAFKIKLMLNIGYN